MRNLKPFAKAPEQLAIQAEISRKTSFEGTLLHLQFCLDDPQNIVLDTLRPATSPALERADELWRTTCFEAFIATPTKKKYWELNLSAHELLWNLYGFDDYRQPQPPTINREFALVDYQRTAMTLDCQLLTRLPMAELAVSLCAVVRTAEGSHYFSTHHSGERPDFHDRRSFQIRI